MKLAREAVDFITKPDDRPFFALIAPPACHSPFTPAPQYSEAFPDRQAPRWPSFNVRPTPGEKHWLVNQGPANGSLPDDVIDRVDLTFRERWRTLLSVDDLVSGCFPTVILESDSRFSVISFQVGIPSTFL